jgi:hypothetical protein
MIGGQMATVLGFLSEAEAQDAAVMEPEYSKPDCGDRIELAESLMGSFFQTETAAMRSADVS